MSRLPSVLVKNCRAIAGPNICAGFTRECAEVRNLAVSALGYKDDGGLDVTMNDPLSIGGIPQLPPIN